jgi:hypothetical protein
MMLRFTIFKTHPAIMKYTLLLLLLFISANIVAQTTAFTTVQIDSIVHDIDSVKQLDRMIEEGTLKASNDDGEQEGYFVNLYYRDENKKPVKVTVEHSLFYYDLENYYFFDNKLVFLKLRESEEFKDSLSFRNGGKYYFNNGKLFAREENNITRSKEIIATHLKIASQLLKDFAKYYK